MSGDWASVSAELIPLALVVALSPVSVLGESADTTSSWQLWLRLVGGAVLIVTGVWLWLRRGRAVRSARWLDALGKSSPGRTAAMGLVLALVNPKIIVACAAAGLAISAATLGPAGSGVAAGYFVAMAGSTTDQRGCAGRHRSGADPHRFARTLTACGPAKTPFAGTRDGRNGNSQSVRLVSSGVAVAVLGSGLAPADVQGFGPYAGDTVSQLQAWGYNVMLNGPTKDANALEDHEKWACQVTGIHPTVSGPLPGGQFQTVDIDMSCPPSDNSLTG